MRATVPQAISAAVPATAPGARLRCAATSTWTRRTRVAPDLRGGEQHMTRTRVRRVGALLVGLAFVAASCGSDEDDADDTSTTAAAAPATDAPETSAAAETTAGAETTTA